MYVYPCSKEIGHNSAKQDPLVQKQVSVCLVHTLYNGYNIKDIINKNLRV